MSRLEKAVQELVTATAGELSNRATSMIDETSKRVEAEVRLRKATQDDPEIERQHEQRRRRHSRRHRFTDEVQKQYSTLYIDKHDEKIAGVCAGLARYFGVESWVVRIAALTGLVFMPQIVFPGYWILYFVMEKKHGDQEQNSKPSKRQRRRRRRMAQQESTGDEASNARLRRQDLRHVTTDLSQAELRLRRLESFVTSDRYELQRELAKIERDGASLPTGGRA